MSSIICTVSRPTSSYAIEISRGLLVDEEKLFHCLECFPHRQIIITDSTVGSLYGEKLRLFLSKLGFELSLLSFPHGERFKTRQTKEKLENEMLRRGMGRDTTLLAMGGGVVTDLSGYLAATYCRGIPLIMIPTTLIGMVDAAIGGKTGVNVPQGKNLLGCLYQPHKVLIDPLLLKTLPERERKNGIVEMIKHGAIADAKYFEFLEKECFNLWTNEKVLQQAIRESCRIKKSIVEEEENGKKRDLLNFGHTIAHALETLTDYSLSHGEAVAIGIVVESWIALQMGLLDLLSFNRIKSLLNQFGISFKLPAEVPFQGMREILRLDKKSQKGEPRFVLLKGIGEPLSDDQSYSFPIEEGLLNQTINWMNHDLSNN